ncbi:MAG: hypothetical protein IPG45_20330 [Deltaproteobacteria bacterium]|nr:hypothetical protein [Deltaproteobacteria bacterium]
MRTPTLIVGLGLAGCTTSVGPGPMPAGLNVYEESRLEGLVLQPGRRLGPDEALPLLRPLVEAWASLPPALRPPQVVVHLDPQATPPIDRVEVHRPSGSILVMRRAIPELARGIWLHELAHVLMSGPRPTGSLDSRLIAAVEEGVADYFARVWSGPVERPGFVGGSVGWEALALPALRFDPHPLGERLDRHLADHYGASEPLLLDLIDCFRGRRGEGGIQSSPATVLDTWALGCAPEARVRVRAALQGWLPAELRGEHEAPQTVLEARP